MQTTEEKSLPLVDRLRSEAKLFAGWDGFPEAHALLKEAAERLEQVEAHAAALKEAVEANDPKKEIALRVSDILALTKRR